MRVEQRAVLREGGVLRGHAAGVRPEVRVDVQVVRTLSRPEARLAGEARVAHVRRGLEHAVVAGHDAHEELVVQRAVAMAGVPSLRLVGWLAGGAQARTIVLTLLRAAEAKSAQPRPVNRLGVRGGGPL